MPKKFLHLIKKKIKRLRSSMLGVKALMGAAGIKTINNEGCRILIKQWAGNHLKKSRPACAT
jgi:hypothetical protein